MAKICPKCHLEHNPGQVHCIPKDSASDKHIPPRAELDQPSVIVEMSFVEKHFPVLYSKHVKIGIAVVVILACTAAGSLWYLNHRLEAINQGPLPTATTNFKPEPITLTIIASPKYSTIYVDGRKQRQNPVVLDLMSDNRAHTIIAKAAGHETLERDVKFDTTQSIRLELVEIIVPIEEVITP